MSTLLPPPRQAKLRLVAPPPPERAAEAPPPVLTYKDIMEIESLLAAARTAIDDLWDAAADAASKTPMTPRSYWRRDVHRRGFEVLRYIRAAESQMEELRKRLR